MRKFSLFLTILLFASVFYAQIPAGYVQTTATVSTLAGGQFGASWTNLSSSSQLGLLGCVSTFQTTVSGQFDANGHFSTLLADVAQICPTPSTWTFTFTFLCVGNPSPGGFSIQVPITGGGGTEDITTQITAALPTNPCPGGAPGTSVINPGTTGQIAYYSTNGRAVSGETSVPVTAGGTGATTAAGALANLGAAPANAVVRSINGTPGAFTFSGSGVTCSATTCVFTGSTFNPASPGPIGGTTPSTGAFTNITATGTIAAGALTATGNLVANQVLSAGLVEGGSFYTTGYANLGPTTVAGNASFSGTVAAGATNPVTIGGASGSCAGEYAKADGTGCGTPSGGAITASLPNTMVTVTPNGSSTSTAAAGVPIASTVGAVLGSNSLPPTSHYTAPPCVAPTCIEYPLLQLANLDAGSSGLSNAANGIVATTSGTAGTGTITLPQPIDPTKPWRLVVHFIANDTAANLTNVQFVNPLNNAGYYFALDATSGLPYAQLSLFNGNFITDGSLISIPTGTGMSLSITSDGAGVWPCVIPDVLAGVATYGTNAGYSTPWNGYPVCGEMASNYVDPTYGPLNSGLVQLKISNASTSNVITGVYLIQGSLNGPADGKMLTPGFANPCVALDQGTTAPAACGFGAPLGENYFSPNTQIWIPNNYGSANGSPVRLYQHQNGNFNAAMLSTLGAYFNDGYIVVAPNTLPDISPSTTDYTNALTSNWGAPTGELWRKAAVDWVRANLPSAWQLGHFSYSMGCENALNYEKAWPGATDVVCVSGITNLTGAYNQSGNPFGTIINNAYGDWYLASQASTNQNPASTTGYWQKIATGPSPIAQGYLRSGSYQYRDYWQSANTYAQGQFVNVAYAGGISGLAAYDPTLNPDTYNKTPVYLENCSGDTLITSVQWTAFPPAVNAVGGNVTSALNGDAGGSALSSTAFSIATAIYGQSAPISTVTFTVPNSATAGQGFTISGLTSTVGLTLNGLVGKILAAGLSSTQLELQLQGPAVYQTVTTTTDAGTLTPMTCNHGTADLQDNAAFITFSDTYRSINPAARYGATPPAIATLAPVFPSPVLTTRSSIITTASATVTAKTFATFPVAAFQSVVIHCALIYQINNAGDKMDLTLTGPSLTGSPNGAVAAHMQSESSVTAGVPTYQVVTAPSSTTYPTMTPSANVGAASTNYDSDVWVSLKNSATAGLLALQFSDTTGYSITMEPGGWCSMYPVQ